jgi:spore coat-associated protein N
VSSPREVRPAATRPRRSKWLPETILLAVAVATLALAVLGVGGTAVFTLSERNAGASSAFAALGPLSVNTPANRLGVAAAGLSPGALVQRVVDIRNTGTARLARLTLTTTASPRSRLDTDRVNGLQLRIERCPVPWIEHRSVIDRALTYACPAPVATVLASRPVVQTLVPLAGVNGAPGAHNYLRVILTFPRNAPRALQGQFSTLHYTFIAI